MRTLIPSNRSAAIGLLLASVGCGTPDRDSSRASDQPPIPPTRPVRQVPKDAAPPQLARPREEFWAQYLGADGAPGPQMLSFCKEPKMREFVDVAPGVAMARWSDVCQLIVDGAGTLDEVRTILVRWNAKDLVAATDHLNVGVIDNPKTVFVNWEPYVPLEQILGNDGQFLVGFDVKKMLGKAGTSMRDAVSKPLVVEADCEVVACAAYGQRPPGGDPVRIGITRQSSNIMATIATTRELVPRLHALLDASLGPGQQEGPVSVHVHHHDGVRYEVRDSADWAGHPVVDVIISPDKP